jgi:hypothetical protein
MKTKHISIQQILILTLLVVFCVLLSGCGAKKQKVYRVGILSGLDYMANAADGFKAKMDEETVSALLCRSRAYRRLLLQQ